MLKTIFKTAWLTMLCTCWNIAIAATTLNLAASPENPTSPAAVTLSVTVSSDTGSVTVTQVEYFNGATSLGVMSDAPFTLTLPNMAAGTYVITAKATTTDPNNPVLQSAPLTLTVAMPAGSATAYFIHTDQLNTPRAITNSSGAVVWQWDSDPFGKEAANEQPSGQAPFAFNMRFPGQYFDRETNLHYNLYRDYDPSGGRYIESDLIGLAGGINTYSYVRADPINYTDSEGLAPDQVCVAACTIGGGIAGGLIGEGIGGVAGGVAGGTGGSVVAPGPGTIGGTVVGGAMGSKAGGIVGAAAGAWVGNSIGNALCPNDAECSPPAGTQCYTGPDTTHSHAGLKPHYHIYQMFKFNGQCKWKYLGGKVGKGVLPMLPEGMAPCSSFPGFEGR